jgi:sterol desaturase/sphingolipid hydroxylase (fatty acid hydroxylase superfamily)
VTFDPLPYAAPVFLAALALESWCSGRYSRRSLVSALGCAMLDQLVAGWGLLLFLGAFASAHRVAGAHLPADRIATWIVAVVGHDLAYYAYHRASHRVNVLWAAHVVHHQSEGYDLTVSLRQGAIATWITYLFYLPLALVVDVQVFVVVHAAYQVYQFFVHTRWARSFGVLEWLFATPTHHRVHHGSERACIDRNYGGFFILFDRLLGTYRRVDRVARYGVPGGYEIVSPTFANTYMLARMVAASGAARHSGGLLRLWFGPPEASTHLLSSAGHAPRVVEHTPALRTWLLVIAGSGAAMAVVLARSAMPLWFAISLGIVAVALFEIASAPLDGR